MTFAVERCTEWQQRERNVYAWLPSREGVCLGWWV
jgi:hypothetical protein